DFHVTGVQTCALPISASPLTAPTTTSEVPPAGSASASPEIQANTPEKTRVPPAPAAGARGPAPRTAPASPPAPTPPPALQPEPKIGRASCREQAARVV